MLCFNGWTVSAHSRYGRGRRRRASNICQSDCWKDHPWFLSADDRRMTREWPKDPWKCTKDACKMARRRGSKKRCQSRLHMSYGLKSKLLFTLINRLYVWPRQGIPIKWSRVGTIIILVLSLRSLDHGTCVFVFSNTVGVSFPFTFHRHDPFPGLLPEGLLEKYFIYQELKLLDLNLLKSDIYFLILFKHCV